jgi:hypothetical protein
MSNIKLEAMYDKIYDIVTDFYVEDKSKEDLIQELLDLYNVSQQSELLIRFGFYVTNGNYKKLCNDIRTTVKNFEANI